MNKYLSALLRHAITPVTVILASPDTQTRIVALVAGALAYIVSALNKYKNKV